MIIDPFRLARLVCVWRIEAVTLLLPVQNVQSMLPSGIRLGRTEGIPAGYHPFRLYFNEVHATMSWPPGFPVFTYQEIVSGIPDCYRTAPTHPGAYVGPFYYMPKVWVSTTPGGVFALGGLMWGIPKSLGRFDPDAFELPRPPWQGGSLDGARGGAITLSQPFGSIALGNQVGYQDSRILGLQWHSPARYDPVEFPQEPGVPRQVDPEFRIMRQIMDQPLLMQFPLGLGPWWAAANFKMTWPSAYFRPIESRVHVYDSFVAGLPIGSYDVPPLWSETRAFGGYQLYCPMELSLPTSTATVGWSHPATTLLGPPSTSGVPSGVTTGA